MKPVLSLVNKSAVLLGMISLSFSPVLLNAQLCTNPVDSVYTLTTSGEFHSLNINTGAASAGILGGTAVTNALNSNGLGFSSLTGKFYFFNRCANADFNEFVSYDPVTKTKQVLANPPAPMSTATTNKIRTGAVNNAGTGYYTILTNSPATAATFYYYNIPLNTWKVIANSFKDTATAASMDSMFHYLNSGDMAFDGTGNLWIICSKNPKYALYKVNAPVTTNAVPKLAVSVMVPTRNMPIATSVASITGVAFSSAGKLFFTTGSNSALATGLSTVGTNYNILYRMTSITPLVIDSITNLPNSYGDDMTSCSYPVSVLGISFNSFIASLQNNAVKLLWKVTENEDVSAYNIEYSSDAEHWVTIDQRQKDDNSTGLHAYYYTANGYSTGKNYYRIAQLTKTGAANFSEIRVIDVHRAGTIAIGPNPVNDLIYLYNRTNNSKLIARVFDSNGRLVYSTVVAPDQQSINIRHLTRGQFILKLSTPGSDASSSGLLFIKW